VRARRRELGLGQRSAAAYEVKERVRDP
jgi:hypothetical protein